MQTLHKHKLLFHNSQPYDGYRLTYSGYDFLALKAMYKRGCITAVGRQIGVGKESDIFLATNEAGETLVLKLHRLGRTSFRAIKNKRDYLRGRKAASWIYMSRLSALREFAFMKALYDNDFPVPKPHDVSRHAVLMNWIPGYPMSRVKRIGKPRKVYRQLMDLISKLAECGLIHCDFNEFNIMIDDDAKVTLIDFPQMVSTTHQQAQQYFARDVDCVRTWFARKYHYESRRYPVLNTKPAKTRLDILSEASGYNHDSEEFLSKTEAYRDPSSMHESRLPTLTEEGTARVMVHRKQVMGSFRQHYPLRHTILTHLSMMRMHGRSKTGAHV